MIVQELLTKLGFTVDPAGIERGKSALSGFKSFALRIGIGTGIALLGKTAFDTATQMEDLNVQFKTLLGSQAAGVEMMGKVTKFAAQTPYELPELANATKKLIAYQVENEKIMPTLQRVGDIAAGLKIPINDLADIYGKARTQGTLMSEDINQLTGRGIPIIGEFAKQFGVAEGKIKEMASKGKIKFKDLETAFKSMTDKGGKFHGMMEELAKTTTGKLSTAMDNLKMTAARAFEGFLPFIKNALDWVGSINFEPVIAFFSKAAKAIEYLGMVFWNSGVKEAVVMIETAMLGFLDTIAGSADSAGGLGNVLLNVGRVLGWLVTVVFMAAATIIQFATYFVGLINWAIEYRDILIGLGIVLFALFGPAMVARILATASATRVAAIANLFFQQAALASGAAAGYQVTMMGALRAAAFNVRGAFMAARTAVMAFGIATIGTMALAFAAVAAVGFAVYRIWEAVSEKRELEERTANAEAQAKITEQILENTKEWQKAKDRGDKATMDVMSARIAERREAYKKIGADAQKSLESESFPSFDAMLKAGTGKMDLEMQKTTNLGKRDVKVENNMEFNVNAPANADGKTGLTADQISELAAQAARATFNIQMQRVTVGMI